jgi:protein phosphatase
MGVNLQAAVVTDAGLIRSNNEDLAYVGRRLIAVADGMGGLPAGELASAIMIRTLEPLEAVEQPTGSDALAALASAVGAANDEIRSTADADPARAGMGTTLTSMLFADDGSVALVHVGDSRGYRFRDGELNQVTIDDTYVQMLVDAGEIEPGDARHHPQRALVTQAVQGGDFEPHCMVLAPETGDRYLLCSDGLSDVLTDETIATALATYPDPHECAERLVKLTLASGAPDNVTVVIGDIG